MSDVPVQIEYNQRLKPLEELLRGVKRPGDFFASGVLALPMPRLEIEGAGLISFPVPEGQARRIIAAAERAPYGRGAETILDTAVRKVWQLGPAKVHLGGKSWPASFAQIMAKVKAGLGCGEAAVKAEFYKLLVYDPGGFFLPHRDTEKADGMFATMVLSLPSAHRGGELIVRHTGREAAVELSTADFSEIGFVAFYADCEHEVRPIVEGHRVCLVYNLILERPAKRSRRALQPPDYEAATARAAGLLEAALKRGPVKIAWLLEHQYSPAGLSFAALKSADAARAQVLCKAAARAGCAAHLAIVHIEESGIAEPQYDGGHGGGWHYSHDDEDEDDSGENFEVIEVCDWNHFLDQWVASDDRPADFGRIAIAPGELLPGGALDEEKPDEQRLMEASGNEGASFERSYHRAAIVVWRRERYAEVLLQGGAGAAMPYLEELVAASAGPRPTATARKEAIALAKRMLDRWEATPDWQRGQPETRDPDRGAMLDLLRRLGDAKMAARFIAGIVMEEYDGSENAALAAVVSIFKTDEAGPLLATLLATKMPSQAHECTDLLARLADRAGEARPLREAALRVAEAAVGALAGIEQPGEPRRFRSYWNEEEPVAQKPVTPALVADLLDAVGKLDAAVLRETAAASIAGNVAAFEPASIVVPALSLLAKRHRKSAAPDPASRQLWDHAAHFLLERSEQPPEPPRDWHLAIALPCHCEDCRELQAFARDPVAREHRFRIKKERRQHLHRTIEDRDLDMTHVTDRHGSPQTLVCTKTRRHHEQRCAQHAKDRAAMSELIGLLREPQSREPQITARLRAAAQRKTSAPQ